MRKETITKTYYQFNELSEKAKEKAIESLYSINIDFGWWDYIGNEELSTVGLKLDSFDIERGSYCKLENILDWYSVAEKIKEEHGGNCETHILACEFLKDRDKLVKKFEDPKKPGYVDTEKEYDFDQACDWLENVFKHDLQECYLSTLRRGFEYLTSREAIEDTIEASAYEFNENGELQ